MSNYGSLPGRAGGLPLSINLDPDKAVVLVGQYGGGLGVEHARRDGRLGYFTQPLDKATKSIKVLISYPGYKLVMAELQRGQISATTPFEPEFEELPLLPVTIKLTKSDGTAIAGQKLSLWQPSIHMDYLGSSAMTITTTGTIASGVTDASGNVTMQVPALLRDPAYSNTQIKPSMFIGRADPSPVVWNGRYVPPGIQPPAGRKTKPHVFTQVNKPIPERPFSERTSSDLVPASIPAQESYPEPIIVKQVFRGTIDGRVEQTFLASHKIDAPLGKYKKPNGGIAYRVWFRVTDCVRKIGQGVGVGADGTFSAKLPPGEYDLSMEVRDQNDRFVQAISIEKGFVLAENENRKIVLE